MKSVRVMVVVPLLLFLHNLTPASSDDEVQVQTAQTTPPAKMDKASPAGSTPSPTASKAVQEPKVASTAAPTTIQVTTAPQGSTNQPADSNKSELKASTIVVTAPPATTTDLKVVPTAPAVVSSQDNDTSKNISFQPRSPQLPDFFPGNHSKTTTDKNDTDVIAETTEKQKTGKDSHQTVPPPSMPQTERGTTREGAGPQTGTNEEGPKKSDKRLWWILLPALLAAAAAAMVLRFKCKKVHDHTETIDTGTENASFQSRPESTKDGVMLLGVKSSGGEENAAAR